MKPFKETALGTWLEKHAPDVLQTVGAILPDKGALGIVKNLISAHAGLKSDQKAEFDQLAAAHELEYFKEENRAKEEEQRQVTERQRIDMTSDSWMSKNIRPYTLAYLLLLLTIMIILDSSMSSFNVDAAYVELLKMLLLTVFVFYFGGRVIEKVTAMKKPAHK